MKIVNRIFYVNVAGMHHTDVAQYCQTIHGIISKGDFVEKANSQVLWGDLIVPVVMGDNRVEINVIESETTTKESALLAKAILDLTPLKKKETK